MTDDDAQMEGGMGDRTEHPGAQGDGTVVTEIRYSASRQHTRWQ